MKILPMHYHNDDKYVGNSAYSTLESENGSAVLEFASDNSL